MAKREFKNWRQERDDDNIVWLHFDMAGAGTNVLSRDVLDEFDIILTALSKENPRGLIILSDKKSGFIAGADITEFTKLKSVDHATEMIKRGQSIFQKLEDLPFPTLSLIHGFCLGGGMEMALACQYRVADNDASTRLGLPEVQLGIHPGYGGTVRLPPLIGAPDAMDLMLTGRTIDARRAKKMGLVDYAVATRHLKEKARSCILNKPHGFKLPPWKKLLSTAVARPVMAHFLKKQVAKRASKDHYPAPYALIDLWQKHTNCPPKMQSGEADSVSQLILGDTAPNLLRVFFLRERLKSLGKKSDFSPKHVHVIGAGVMGGDIATWCALKGFNVTLQDREPKFIAPAIKRAHKLFKKRLKRPHLVQAAMDRLLPDTGSNGVARADVVIEAIFENIDAKQALYKDIEPRMKPDALFATNTSSIPLEELSCSLSQPDRLVGVHFFNPVAKMPLVEIVIGPDTNKKVSENAAAFARKIDRLPLPVKSSPGFLVNRILMPYLLEAVLMESEGIPAGMIDRAALKFGMPMGPILLADTVGLDICLSVGEIMSQKLKITVPERLRKLVKEGKLGAKSGGGFYKYKKGKPITPKPDRTDFQTEEITDRLILRFINEAVACIQEGVVEDSDLLDAGVIFGTGFAPFRGGPLNHLHKAGVKSLLNRLNDFESRFGERFSPNEGWKNVLN